MERLRKWEKLSGKNGVPEYLHELSQKLPAARIAGSWLAIYSPKWWTCSGAEIFKKALVEKVDPWASEIACR